MAIIPIFMIASGLFAAGDPIVIDARHQLFLDDTLVASMENVTRCVQPATKFAGNPVLRPTEPWEGDVVIVYGSILRDGDRYRAWYHAGPGVCYAESEDGITWTKPRLDVILVDGAPTNILIDRDAAPDSPNALPHFYEVFGVSNDDREADPERRYKMGFLSIERDYTGPRQDPFHGNQRRGLAVAGSPDGIHWTLIDSWSTEAICDGATHWMFDPARDKYVLYGRTKYIAPEVKEAWAGDAWAQANFWGRSVARTESPDFLDWDFKDPASAPVVMTVDPADAPATEIYSMQVFPYEGAYIGLVQAFLSRPEGTLLELQLAASPDGVAFTRVADHAPFIPCGPVSSWDRFNNSAANNPPIEIGDELRFYYGGRTYRHSPYEGDDKGDSGGYIGFASIQRDRFVSLEASFDGGTVTTPPVMLPSAAVHVNAKADFGEIRVTLLDKEGAVVAESEPIRQDGLDIPVAWTGDAPARLDEPVALRFALRNAKLFAFWCP